MLNNLDKVKDDPEVRVLASQARAEVEATGATKPKESSLAEVAKKSEKPAPPRHPRPFTQIMQEDALPFELASAQAKMEKIAYYDYQEKHGSPVVTPPPAAGPAARSSTYRPAPDPKGGPLTYKELSRATLLKKGVVSSELRDMAEDGGTLILQNNKAVGWYYQDEDATLQAIEIKSEYQKQGIGRKVLDDIGHGDPIYAYAPNAMGAALNNTYGTSSKQNSDGIVKITPYGYTDRAESGHAETKAPALDGNQVAAATVTGENVKPMPNGETQSPPQATSAPPTFDTAKLTTRLVENFPVSDLHADPHRFQYKIGHGQGGQTGSLTGAAVWNPNLAGILSVWRDPLDGLVYVVNGHNRYAHALRVGQKGVDVRFLDAKNAQDARTEGAIINIAEGQGTAIDAAKLFRDQKITGSDLKSLGVTLKQQKAEQGMALSTLASSIFDRVVRGELPVERAAIIGSKLTSHDDQNTLIAQADKSAKSGKPLTNAEVSELADAIHDGPRHEDTTTSLFGDETTAKSTVLERAEISAYLRSQLTQEGGAFKAAAKNAGRLAKGNNVIDAERSEEIALLNEQGRELFDRLKNAPGPISDIITQAANRLAAGEKANVVKSEALTEFQNALPSLVKSSGADAGSSLAGQSSGANPARSGSDRAETSGVRSTGDESRDVRQQPSEVAPSALFDSSDGSDDLLMTAPKDVAKAAPPRVSTAENGVMFFGDVAARPFVEDPQIPSAVRQIIHLAIPDATGNYAYTGALPKGENQSVASLRAILEKRAASGYGGIYHAAEGGMNYRVTSGDHTLQVILHPDDTVSVHVKPVAKETGGMFDEDTAPNPKVQASEAFSSSGSAPNSTGRTAAGAKTPAKEQPTKEQPSAADTGEYPAGSTLNAGIDPGLGKLYRDDITPAMQTAVQTLTKMQDAVFRLLSPASIDNAGIAARSFREHSAAMAQQEEIAFNELKAFGKLLKKMDRAKRLAFYDTIETGGKQPTPEMQVFADMMRKLLDDARDEVRGLSTGKLSQFLTDYMPHYYKDLGKAKEYYAKHYGQRGLNPSASFLKQRTYDTLADAMAAGLEPKSDDPIEMVMTKVKEMHRYVMAQRVLADIKTDPNLSRYVGTTDGHPPGTWEPLAGTEVWKGSQVEVKEAFDKLVSDKLDDIFQTLQINHSRKQALSGGTAWGQAQGKNTIRSKFGGPESVLIHELGHIIDARYKVWDYLTAPNLRVAGVAGARKRIGQELKDLADLRYEGQPTPGPVYRQYVRQKGEKVANAIMAMIYAPEKMQAVAPTVLLRLKKLIGMHPELAPLLDLKPSLVLGERSQAMDVGGRILAGQYYAPPEVARVYNNYLSPGLNGNNIFYDALRFVGNAMNQAQLGLSGFHFMFTLNDAMFSQLAVGVQRLGVGAENVLRGTATLNKQQVAIGARQIALSPVDMMKAPIAGALYASIGAKFQKEYYHPGTQGAEMARIVDAAIAGGVRVRMDSHYQNDAASAFWKSLRTGGERFAGGNPIGGTLHGAAALSRAPFALVEMTAKPLMEKWVPLMKTGAVANLLQQAIDDLPPNANLSRDDLRKMAAQAVDTVDDRMGQLNYDNLFWNKVFKDLLMGSTRSVGWNIGSLRVIGGAGYDALSTPKRLLSSRGAGRGGQQPPGGGRQPPGGAGSGPGGNSSGGSGGAGGFGYEPVMTQRIAYMIALLFGAGLMGAIFQFLHTGKAPHDLKDLYFPRTGKTADNGKPERVQMATYMKDVHGYTTQPVQTFANKLHPVLSTAYDAMQNKDYFGTEIRNPDDPKVKQVADVAKYALAQFEPFSYSNAVKNGTNVLSERGVENFFGITPAPKDIDFTPAEKMMLDYLKEGGGDTRTQAQAAEAKEKAALLKEGRSGASIKEKLEMAVRGGDLTLAQARAVYRGAGETWQVEKFKKLSADQALHVFGVATPSEKRTFAPYLKMKGRGQTPQFKTKALDALRAMTR